MTMQTVRHFGRFSPKWNVFIITYFKAEGPMHKSRQKMLKVRDFG